MKNWGTGGKGGKVGTGWVSEAVRGVEDRGTSGKGGKAGAGDGVVRGGEGLGYESC